ncbi:MAG: response regulator [Burkholderiales bacterium]|nr:response regulator [Burkholderiales bacterium]
MTVAAHAQDRPAARLRALVIEDSPDDYELIVRALAAGPWRVRAERVEDAAGLRAALAASDWDVVISDHNLPQFDAFSALALVRATEPEVPFIIVSGRIGEDVAVDAMLAGADDYVMKHNLARLRPAVARCLEARALKRKARAAEARERESESRLAAIAAHLPGVVFQLRQPAEGAPAEFVYLSDGAAELLGRTPAQLLANPREILALTAGPGEPLAARLRACAATGSPLVWEGQVGNGPKARWVSVSASPRAVGGGARVWDGIMVDVTSLKNAEAKLRDLSADWERRMEEERAAIARELHDEVGGALAALKADAAWLRRRVGTDPAVRERIDDVERLLDALIGATTRLAQALRPGALDLGLSAALEARTAEVARRLGIDYHFATNDEELALPADAAMALYRVFQEALTNVTKHAGASRIEVELFATASEVTLEVRDNGRGLAPEDLAKPDRFGVRGMRERIARLGGWLEVSGEPGRGTTVMAGVPRARPVARA